MAKLDFNPMTTRYDPINALALGRVAKLAYEGRGEIEAQAREWGLASHFISEHHPLVGDTQVAVLGDADKVIVGFRGTQPKNLRDWMTDARVALVPGPTGMVHKGFLDALMVAYAPVREAIDRLQDRGQSLWVTGHSLGAALATLLVTKLRFEEDKPVFGCYTFGQPRSGDRTFARAFDADFKPLLFRFVNNNDVVPRVPPRATLYSHVGTFLYFDRDRTLRTDEAFWFRFLDSVKGAKEDFLNPGPDAVKDHSMTEYIAGLERKAALPA